MVTGNDEETNSASPWVKAGLRAYDQQNAKQRLLEQIVNDAIKDGKPTLAA